MGSSGEKSRNANNCVRNALENVLGPRIKDITSSKGELTIVLSEHSAEEAFALLQGHEENCLHGYEMKDL